jgi:hypothetical protein
MKIIGYLTEEEDKLYDFDTMRKILNSSRSKLHREIKKNKVVGTKFKNQYLYSEHSLFLMMERYLIERLDNDRLQEDSRTKG